MFDQTGPFCTVGCVGDVDDDEALLDDGDDNAEGVEEDEDGDDNALSYFSKISLAWALTSSTWDRLEAVSESVDSTTAGTSTGPFDFTWTVLSTAWSDEALFLINPDPVRKLQNITQILKFAK